MEMLDELRGETDIKSQGLRVRWDLLISMSNLTDSGSFVNRSSRVAKEAWMYSLLIFPLYESKPLDSLSLNSNVCFMRSMRLFALGC